MSKHKHEWIETYRQQMTWVREDGTFDPPPPAVRGYRCDGCDEFRPAPEDEDGDSEA